MGYYDSYMQALKEQFGALTGRQNEQQTRTSTVNNLQRLAKIFMPAQQAASTYNLGLGTMQGADAVSSLASGSNAVTPIAEFSTTAAAPSVGPTVAAVSGGAAAGTGAGTGAAAGTTAGASASSIAAPVAVGLAIGSSSPGDFLFPAKKFMYNAQQGINKWTGVNAFSAPMEKLIGPMGNPNNQVNWVFGDPNEQEKQRSRQKAIGAAMGALQGEKNIQKLAFGTDEEQS